MALELIDVSHRYRGHPALSGFSLRVEPGACTGFIGPNGAGKTTAMRVALGLIRPQAGRVLVDGLDLNRSPVLARAALGALIEIPGFHDSWSAEANLVALARLRGEGLASARDRARRLIALVGLEAAGRRAVRGFSQGMRQRLGIAQALVGSPRYLLLDEPGNGLDPDGLAALKDLVRRLVDEAGMGVLLSSHQLSDLAEIADRIVMIDHGRPILEGRTQDLIASTGIETAPRGGGLEAIYLRLREQALRGKDDASGSGGVPTITLPSAPPAPPGAPVRVLRLMRYELARLRRSPLTALAYLAPVLLALLGVWHRMQAADAAAAMVARGEAQSTTSVTAYEALSFGLASGLPLVVLVLALIAAQSLAGELSRGTLRNLVIAPFRRVEIFLGKLGAQAAMAVLAVAAVWIASFLFAATRFEFTGISEVLATGGKTDIVSAAELREATIEALTRTVLPFVCVTALGFLAGALVAGAVEAFGLALGLLLVLDLGRSFLPGRADWRLLPSGHWPSPLGDSSFLRRFGDQAQGFSNAATCFEQTPLVYWILACVVLAALAFRRRSIR